MAGSVYGTLFKVTTWGESHGKALGAVIDGCPAGLPLAEQDIQKFLDRRKPGQNKYTTARHEADEVEILSGVFEGRTEGTPISMVVRNRDPRSKDYSEIAGYYRPGHADYTFDQKYGFRDYRGGGRSSGRETIGRVCGGAVASRVLQQLGIQVTAYTSSIGPVTISRSILPSGYYRRETGSGMISDGEKRDAGPEEIRNFRAMIAESPLFMPDPVAETKAQAYLDECLKAQDSAGGSVECLITGMRSGIGETVFDKLDAELGKALLSIGAVKAVEIGDGREASLARGSSNNDQYTSDGKRATEHAGGILGGMSDGSDILVRAWFKPTPSIARPQKTLFRDGSVQEAVIRGRHDPVIVPRAVVVVESMAAMTVLDLLLRNMTARMDGIRKFYGRRDE